MVEDDSPLAVHRYQGWIHAERSPGEVEEPAQFWQGVELVKRVH